MMPIQPKPSLSAAVKAYGNDVILIESGANSVITSSVLMIVIFQNLHILNIIITIVAFIITQK